MRWKLLFIWKKNHNIPRNSEGKEKKINSSFDIETFKLQRISDIVFFSPVNNFNRVLPTNSVAGIIFIKIISSLFFFISSFFYHHTMLFNPPRLEVKVRDHLSLSFHCNYSNIAYNCRVHSPKYKADIIKMSFI